MKRNQMSWVYFSLQIVFFLIAPCVMVWVQYGGLTQKYKLSITAIILILAIFLIFKKVFLNKWLKTFEMKIANIETNALSITDTVAIQSNKKMWRNYSLLQLFFSAIIPFLILLIGFISINAVENGLIKLSGCFVFCAISIGIGVLFRIAEIYSMKLKHEE